MAVLCEFAATKMRMPAAYVCDLVVACLASLLHKDLCVLPYAGIDASFRGRPRYWACPMGDPSTGKSSTFRWVMDQFHVHMLAHLDRFPWCEPGREPFISHVYGRGSHAGLNEVLRDTAGAALLASPAELQGEAVWTPAFPPDCNVIPKVS